MTTSRRCQKFDFPASFADLVSPTYACIFGVFWKRSPGPANKPKRLFKAGEIDCNGLRRPLPSSRCTVKRWKRRCNSPLVSCSDVHRSLNRSGSQKKGLLFLARMSKGQYPVLETDRYVTTAYLASGAFGAVFKGQEKVSLCGCQSRLGSLFNRGVVRESTSLFRTMVETSHSSLCDCQVGANLSRAWKRKFRSFA